MREGGGRLTNKQLREHWAILNLLMKFTTAGKCLDNIESFDELLNNLNFDESDPIFGRNGGDKLS